MLIGVVFVVTSDAAHAQYIFWSDFQSKSVFRADLDGENRTTIFQKTTEGVGPQGLAFDAPSNNLFWINDGTVYRSNIDGELIGVHAIGGLFDFEEHQNPLSVALDLSGRLSQGAAQIYFGGDLEEIFRIAPDGTGLSEMLSFNDDPIVRSLAIDFEQGRFYWSSHGS